MDSSNCYKVDGLNIKELKTGTYKTFYFENNQRTFYFTHVFSDKTKVVKIEEKYIKVYVIDFSGNKKYQHIFDKNGKLVYDFRKRNIIDNNGNLFSFHKEIISLGESKIITDLKGIKIDKLILIKNFDHEQIIYEKIPELVNNSNLVFHRYRFSDFTINLFEIGDNQIEEIKKSSHFVDYWFPKYFNIKVPKSIIKEFLYIYFLLKNILISQKKKIESKDLLKYIYSFLFEF